MIDLHTHTTYSDGHTSLVDLLKEAEELGLTYIAITDHNTIEAYKELEKMKLGLCFQEK